MVPRTFAATGMEVWAGIVVVGRGGGRGCCAGGNANGESSILMEGDRILHMVTVPNFVSKMIG